MGREEEGREMSLSLSFTRDDGMVGDLYLQVQTQLAFNLAKQPPQPHQSINEWSPLVSLRHMAQQIMIRNLADTPRSTPRASRDLGLDLQMSSSSSSCDSSLPSTPQWVEEELHRDRAYSQVGDNLLNFRPNTVCIPIRQRSASFHGAPQPIKRNIDSSLKAAKLLGIEALSGPPRAKPKSPSLTNTMPSSLRQLMDSKMRMFRRSPSFQGGISLKSVTKGNCAQLMDHVEMQRRTLNKSLNKGSFPKRKTWKSFFIVLNANTLYRFEDKHPTSTASDELPLRESTIVCVSDSFSGQQYVLEILDGPRAWYLRFNDKSSLVLWLSSIKDAQSAALPPSSPLPIPNIPSSPRHRINYRHTAPASPFFSSLEKVPEYA